MKKFQSLIFSKLNIVGQNKIKKIKKTKLRPFEVVYDIPNRVIKSK